MWHPFPGFSGVMLGLLAFVLIGLLSYFTKKREIGAYNLDPKGKPGAFEPILTRYLRASEFVIGLATGSIVLLVGSSALHGNGGHLPWFYASPLLLLGLCVLYGVFFMVWLIYQYEMYQHDNVHTRFRYALSETLGFSSLLCFASGYVWLIVAVTR
jgi:hypothetical protein